MIYPVNNYEDLEVKKVNEKNNINKEMTSSSDSYSNRTIITYNSNRARRNSNIYERSLSNRETPRLSLTEIIITKSINIRVDVSYYYHSIRRE